MSDKTNDKSKTGNKTQSTEERAMPFSTKQGSNSGNNKNDTIKKHWLKERRS